MELISSELVFYLEQQPGYWQQTQIFPAELLVDDVASLSLAVDAIQLSSEEAVSAQYQLERVASTDADGAPEEWRVVGSSETALDQLQVETLISSILIIQADSFSARRAREIDFSALTEARISVALRNGTQYSLAVVSEQQQGPNAYLLRAAGPDVLTRSDGSDHLYNVNSFSLRPLIQPLSELLPPQTQSAEPES